MRAQVSLFIIIGIVLLFVIVGLLYFSSSVNEQELERTTTQTQLSSGELEPIINYVDVCIESLAKKGIFLLGEQGGYIYKSQGGLKSEASIHQFLTYNDKKVPLRIFRPVRSRLCKPELPQYPANNIPYPYGNSYDFDELSDNDYLETKTFERENCFGDYHKFDERKVFRNIERYIENNINATCPFTSFSNFDIQKQDAKVTIKEFGEQTVVNVSYPLQVTHIGTQNRADLNEFFVTLRFSMLDFLDLVSVKMQKDVNDPTYDFGQADYDTSKYSVFVIPSVQGEDDVIRVVAHELTIDAREFELLFARQNRPPALEYVHNTSFNEVPLAEGYVINYADVIHQTIEAHDPDEDEVTVQVVLKEGIFAHVLNETNPYTIDSVDTQFGIVVQAQASDAEFTDYQDRNDNYPSADEAWKIE